MAHLAKAKSIIAKYNFSFKKSLGQNFLVDANILRLIIHHAELDEKTGVIEVGAGIGTLTEALAGEAGRVLSFEIDQRLKPILEETLAPYSNVRIIHQDVLKADLRSLVEGWLSGLEKLKVVANLPYYVTTPILERFLESGLPFSGMVLMVQKELAQRLVAKAGSKDYGSLTVFIQYYMEPRLIKVVPPSVFLPKPNVDSALVKLLPRTQPPVAVQDEAFFFQTVRACFAKRRKTLLNNLSAYGAGANKEELARLLISLGIDPKARAEALTIEQFARLANALLPFMKGEAR